MYVGHGRVALLLVFLVFQAVAGPASANVPPAPDPAPPSSVLPITFNKHPAIYREGEHVDMSMSFSATQSQTARRVRAFCEAGCPTTDAVVYEAPFLQALTFPSRDFCQVVNGLRDCDGAPNSKARLEPRWNGTWAVTLNDGAGLEVYRARFRVEMLNAYRYNYSLVPTQVVEAVAGGYIPNTFVKMSFGRLDISGREVLFRNLTLVSSASGQVTGKWGIPKEEATRASCQAGHCHKYFVQVTAEAGSGNTKTLEKLWYFVYPATIHTAVVAGPDLVGQSVEFERTRTINFVAQLTYPSFAFVGAEDFRRVGGPGELSVEIQRIDPTTGVPGLVERRAPVYLTAGLWQVQWTIPRDLQLKTPQGRAFEFRLVVPETMDRYGNVVATNASAPFTVNAAALPGDWLRVPERLERAEPGSFVLAPKYYDGKPFDNTVNQTWLAGRIVRVTDQGDVPVQDGSVRARYGTNGSWHFDYKFPKGYAPLGRHAFVFDGGPVLANDTWNNHVRSNRTPFELVAALPRVHLTEKAGPNLLNATTGWTRGERLDLVARITYLDGSGYDASRHFEGRTLNATLEKRRGSSEVVETILVPFTPRDDAGTWAATLPLSLSPAEAPVGSWTLTFPLRDRESPPNGGDRAFARDVHPASIRVVGRSLDASHYLLGSTVKWRFTLAYPDGKPVTVDDLPVLTVAAYRWSGERRLGIEAGSIAAEWRSDRFWEVTWQPPLGTRLGEFVFVPVGTDKHGNPIGDTRSDSFRVYVPTIEREVLRNPPPAVVRNETVYVVFDGNPGDTGENETGCPRIAVQRWAQNRWVIEVEDVYASAGGACTGRDSDHYGTWLTVPGSSLGTYRFAFFGRDAQRAYVNGTSTSFEILPLSASRGVLAQPPSLLPKGSTATFVVARDPTDRFTEAWILRFGERTTRAQMSAPNMTSWTLRWTPDYRTTGGNFSFEVMGEDRDGNDLRVVSRHFEVDDVAIRSEILEPPPSTVRRGDSMGWTFRAQLPDGTIVGQVHGAPLVVLEGPNGVVAELTPKPAHPNWVAEYRVPADLPLGVYHFRVTGRDDAGNRFGDLSSPPITVVAGTVERDFQDAVKSGTRLTRLTASALANRTDDKGVTCYASYLGPSASPNDGKTIPALATIDITYAPNPQKGVYDLSWLPPMDAALGWYRFDCDGKDAFGNVLRYRSSTFQLLPARISPTIVAGGAPAQDGFVGGRTHQFSVKLAYSDKTTFTPDLGQPDFVITLESRAVEPSPEWSYDNATQTWIVTWKAPEALPPGRYALVAQGRDAYANVILTIRVADYEVKPTLGERLFGIPGFDRAVPGASPLLAAAAALGVALLVFGRRRR